MQFTLIRMVFIGSYQPYTSMQRNISRLLGGTLYVMWLTPASK